MVENWLYADCFTKRLGLGVVALLITSMPRMRYQDLLMFLGVILAADDAADAEAISCALLTFCC